MDGLAIDTSGAVLRAGAMGGRGMGTFFLYLNEDTWIGEAGERLADEASRAALVPAPSSPVHRPPPSTPRRLSPLARVLACAPCHLPRKAAAARG